MRIDGPTHDPGKIALRLGQETAVQDQDFLLQDLLLQHMTFLKIPPTKSQFSTKNNEKSWCYYG